MSKVREKRKTHEATTKHRLLVIGPASTPVDIFKGIPIVRRYLETIHKEAAVIIPRQVVNAAAKRPKRMFKVICGDKDVFILLSHYLPTNNAY